mgnify:CR=1 FL=1
MDAFEVLHTRRSIRQFLNRPVGEDLVKELLSAAMSAPTAGGIQPWRFVVITDREKLDKIPDFHPYAGMIKQAPLAILVCGDTTSANYGKYWVQDCSAAMENLLLAARAKELASLWCGVHPVPEREQAFRELFNLPDTVSALPSSAIPRRLSRIRNVTTNRKCIITSGNPLLPDCTVRFETVPARIIEAIYRKIQAINYPRSRDASAWTRNSLRMMTYRFIGQCKSALPYDRECTPNSPRCIINGDSMSSASGFSTEHIALVYLSLVALLSRCG